MIRWHTINFAADVGFFQSGLKIWHSDGNFFNLKLKYFQWYLSRTSKYSNHLSWLEILTELLPKEIDNIFMREVRLDDLFKILEKEAFAHIVVFNLSAS